MKHNIIITDWQPAGKTFFRVVYQGAKTGESKIK